MTYKFFNKEQVLEALLVDGYFIHTSTSDPARIEANQLSDELKEYFNSIDEDEDEDEVFIICCEVRPACNYGVMRKSDEFSSFILSEDQDIAALKREIEKQRK